MGCWHHGRGQDAILLPSPGGGLPRAMGACHGLGPWSIPRTWGHAKAVPRDHPHDMGHAIPYSWGLFLQYGGMPWTSSRLLLKTWGHDIAMPQGISCDTRHALDFASRAFLVTWGHVMALPWGPSPAPGGMPPRSFLETWGHSMAFTRGPPYNMGHALS